MGDMGELYRDWAEHKKTVKAERLEKAEQLHGWIKHTPYHWSTTIYGKKLNWWPTANKWQFNGKMQAGTQENLLAFIENRVNDWRQAVAEPAIGDPKKKKYPGSDGWTRHTEYHWSRTVRGGRLDYWPTAGKWRYAGGPMQVGRQKEMFEFIKGPS